ncbi:hypothetical protein FTX61_04590 [Nitriliruptoraceae bacterium ZYF776]|nr:hypothetical protein [Profundirhabdus halotolerans]
MPRPPRRRTTGHRPRTTAPRWTIRRTAIRRTATPHRAPDRASHHSSGRVASSRRRSATGTSSSTGRRSTASATRTSRSSPTSSAPTRSPRSRSSSPPATSSAARPGSGEARDQGEGPIVHRTTRTTVALTAVVSLLAPVAAVADDTSSGPADTSSGPADTSSGPADGDAYGATLTTGAPPTPTPALVGPPESVAVLGDSISAGTGSTGAGDSGFIAEERPRNSWATGDYPGLRSVAQRLGELGDAPEAFNLSENGRRARHTLDQVQGSPEGVGWILIQIGGNDLCRDTVEEMTPTAEYREHIDATLAWIAEHRPDARVQINSVPDIYRLWELRRTNVVAVLLWGTGLVPCQSLVARPTSLAEADMQRRAAVRQRGLEYNEQLAQACAAYVRCRFDEDATWLFSNDPGEFLDRDISTQDHFHPSFSGQQKLAEVSWVHGYDATDLTAPTVAVTTSPADATERVVAGPVRVTVTAADDVGVAGIEVRAHAPDGTVGDWEPTFAEDAEVELTAPGQHHLEVRATDVNGNRSAGTVVSVAIRGTAGGPGTPGGPADPGACEPATSFADVAGSYAHADAIRAVAARCIAAGYPDGTYRPGVAITRGQLARFLANALQLAPGDLRFDDVADDHPHAEPISSMAGIAEGFDDGTFRPNAPVTRAQMATLLARAADLPAGGTRFPDVPVGHVHADGVAAVGDAGIRGFDDGTFRPGAAVTRGQMATFLVVTGLADRPAG